MCHVAKGDLPLNIRWYFREEPIKTYLKVISTKIGDRTSVLTISSAQDVNSGLYTCAASNLAGQSNFSSELFVNGNNIIPFVKLCIIF